MNQDILKRLYFEMLRIRLIEEKIAGLYPEQEIRCPVHLCIGQEAVAVGVCAHLSPNDYVFSSHRSHGHYLAKGGDLKQMMAEIYGKATGCSRGKGGSMHLVDLSAGFLGSTPIVASTIPIAVGAAFASVQKGEKRITVPFFGEAAAEEGVFHESLNFAALHQLPVLFLCENNLYSVYSPMSVRQPKTREVFELAKGHGIESHQGDGNDVRQVYEMTRSALMRVREGRPVFLEYKTYRWREHCGPYYDNDLGYRTPEEFEAWKKLCPVERMENFLLREKYLNQTDLKSMRMAIRQEITEAVEFAKESPFPEREALLEDLYA